MSDNLKVATGIIVALILGFVAAYWLVDSAKSECVSAGDQWLVTSGGQFICVPKQGPCHEK